MKKLSEAQAFKYCLRCGSDKFKFKKANLLHCQKCGFKYYLCPRTAVGAIIENNQQEILISSRAIDPGKGKLDLPGGFVEVAETAEQAIRREIKEELNLDISQAKYLMSAPNKYFYSDIVFNVLDLFFLVKVNDFSQLKINNELKNIEFVKADKLELANFAFHSHRKAIEFFQKTK